MALTAEQIRASFEAKKKLLSGGVDSSHAAERQRKSVAYGDQSQPASTGIEAVNRDAGQSHAPSGSSAPPAQNNLPAPVLAEPSAIQQGGLHSGGEARESTTTKPSVALNTDSRGGQKPLSGGTDMGGDEGRCFVPPSQKSKSSTRNVDTKVPQAPEIEVAVLASLYQYPATCFPIFNERARADFFFSPVNRSFFSLLSAYFTEHGQADPQSFLQSLLDSGQLEKHGGSFFLSQLLSATSPPSALEYHLDILRDKFVQRSLYRAAAELARKTMELPQGDLWSIISEHEESIRSLRALAADTMEGVESFSYDDLVGFDPLKDDSVLLGARRWLGKGYTCLWAGGSGYGKSTLEMQAALYWATGTPLFGIKPVRPLKSLILQAENDLGDTGEQLQGVIAGITATGDISLNGEVERMIIVNRLIGCTGDTFLARLSALLKIHRPDLVWIDPLFAFAGCDLIDTEAISNFLRNGLIPIVVEHQVCAHVIHHVSKPARDNDQKKDWSTFDYQYLGFGSSEIQNAFRAVNIILPVSNDPGTFHLILSKRGDRAGATDLNGESTRNIYLCHGKEGSILWTQVQQPDAESGKGSHRPKAFKLIDLLSEMSVTEPLKTSALCKHACTETGMSRATFYRLFDDAKNAQKIKVNDEGWTLS